MKKLLLITLLFVNISLPAISDELNCLSSTWYLGLRWGKEVRQEQKHGFRWDIGGSLFGTIEADAFYIYYLSPKDSEWQINLLAGIPNAGIPLSFNAAMISFGGAIQFRKQLDQNSSFDIRLGAGFPLFFEEGKDVIRDIGFPLNLWPDISIGYNTRY